MIRRLAARTGWWGFVVGGVSWGLLCVGVRHIALRAGREMERLVAERQEAVQRVQVLEREAAVARRLDRVEELAAASGLRKPSPRQLVIAQPEAAAPSWFSRWKGGAGPVVAAVLPADHLKIRPREDVVVGPPVKRQATAAPVRKAPARGHPGKKRR